MDLYVKIRMLCAVKRISMAELARKLGMSPQNFSAKLKRESFTIEEFERIGKSVNMDFQYYFVTPNGDKI